MSSWRQQQITEQEEWEELLKIEIEIWNQQQGDEYVYI
jgi:hypothetical protein